MGQYMTIPAWFGGGTDSSTDDSEEIFAKSIDTDDLKTSSKSDSDVVQLISWLESQGADVTKIQKMVYNLWKKHEETLHDEPYEALQHTLKTRKTYKEMRDAIEKLADERKIAIRTDTESNHASQQETLQGNVEGMIRLISSVTAAAGAGPIGAIMVELLNCIKQVDFFRQECQTGGYRNQSLGIIDITWDEHDESGDGTVLFEIAKIEVQMMNKNREIVFIGHKKVYVDISAYYAKASMKLRNFMTVEQRKHLKAKLDYQFKKLHITTK